MLQRDRQAAHRMLKASRCVPLILHGGRRPVASPIPSVRKIAQQPPPHKQPPMPPDVRLPNRKRQVTDRKTTLVCCPSRRSISRKADCHGAPHTRPISGVRGRPRLRCLPLPTRWDGKPIAARRSPRRSRARRSRSGAGPNRRRISTWVCPPPDSSRRFTNGSFRFGGDANDANKTDNSAF